MTQVASKRPRATPPPLPSTGPSSSGGSGIRPELSDGRVVEARGVVRWVREQDDAVGRQGLGVAFTEMSESTLAALVDYCRTRPPLYFDF